VEARIRVAGSELARHACALDEPTPSLVAAMLAGDLAPGRECATTGQCSMPCMPLEVSARSTPVIPSRPGPGSASAQPWNRSPFDPGMHETRCHSPGGIFAASSSALITQLLTSRSDQCCE